MTPLLTSKRARGLSAAAMVGICMGALGSCERKQDAGGGPESTPPADRAESRKQDRSDRLAAVLRQSASPGPDGGRATIARTADLIAEMIRSHDDAGLRELLEKCDKELHVSHQLVGVALAGALKPEEWNDALERLGGLRTVNGLQFASGLTAKAILLDPGRGEALLQSKVFTEFTEARIGNPSSAIWGAVGSLLYADAKTADLQRIIAMASPLDAGGRESSQTPRGYLASGLAVELRKSIAAGDSDSLRGFGTLFPEDIKVSAIGQILGSGGLKFDAANLPVFQAVLDDMKATPGFTPGSFFRLGANMSKDAFEKVLLKDPSLQDSDQLKETVKGWVSQRPKSSVELVLKTGRQELLRPAFAEWMNQDSIEASQWLVKQPGGESTDLCVEELCIYLAGTDSKSEASGWLSKLPPERQDALKKKYRFE
ncbi:hypothetical protein [Luteolibacter sp. LG18]|uniref:hypothetical protein n=1 Tax=Luteolibacter sp. LG18 TaxID=2819286 RepID=UPI002B30C880|nr:hypothetical protein llg_26570 [Luteolibacter sp. LG18]